MKRKRLLQVLFRDELCQMRCYFWGEVREGTQILLNVAISFGLELNELETGSGESNVVSIISCNFFIFLYKKSPPLLICKD
jgi:hypothetical protein